MVTKIWGAGKQTDGISKVHGGKAKSQTDSDCEIFQQLNNQQHQA